MIAVIGLIGQLALVDAAHAMPYLQGELIGYSESKLTVFERQDVDRAFDIDLIELTIQDNQGNTIHETSVGSQVTLQAGIASYRSIGSDSVIAIFEVRDPDGITDYVAWQNATIISAEQITVTSSWVAPNRPGEYEVRVFALSCINCPMVLSPVLRTTIDVVPSNA